MSDLDDQIFGKVTGDLDVFKKILSKVPGFQGYIERTARRDSDKLLRETIFNRFRALELRVSAIQRQLLDQNMFDIIGDAERAAIKMRTFADRVKTATYGYSGLFDAVKINEAELAQLYAYDAQLLEMADEVERAIDNLEASIGGEGMPAALRHLENVTQQAVDAFDKRQEVVTTGA